MSPKNNFDWEGIVKIISILLAFLGTTAFGKICGGVDASAFHNVQLLVQTIDDSEFFEEGLSFEEYPNLRIEKTRNGHEFDLGAGLSIDDEHLQLVCVDNRFVLNVYSGKDLYIVFKDFRYEAGRVVATSLYSGENNNIGHLVATFTLEGFQFVYGYLRDFTPAGEKYFLSDYINPENSTLQVELWNDGFYRIQIGKIQLNTHPETSEGAFAVYDPNVEILYVEIPKMNAILELHVEIDENRQFSRAKLFAGPIDSIGKMQDVGVFTK